MATALIQNDFEIRPVMELLLKSQHFYDPALRGAIIKNPLEFVAAIVNNFQVGMPEDYVKWYASLKSLTYFLAEMQMSYFNPPSVAGWEAFYLEPQFYKQWINSVTLRPRREFSDKLSQQGFKFSGYRLHIDALAFIEGLDNPADPNDLIEDISLVLYPAPLSSSQKEYLKNILIPGLPDFEWTLEYGIYLEDTSNEEARLSVETRLRNMIQAMLSFPEFYTN